VTTAIITAGGMQEDYQGPEPKQLAVIGGETVIGRAIRLLRPWCEAIHILAWRPELKAAYPQCWMPQFQPPNVLASLMDTRPCWGPQRTVFLHGDVYWDEGDLFHVLVGGWPLQFCGSDLEVFGVVFDRTQYAKMMAHLGVALKESMRWPRRCIDGTVKLRGLYRQCAGWDPAQSAYGHQDYFLYTGGLTKDIDTLDDVANIEAHRRKGCGGRGSKLGIKVQLNCRDALHANGAAGRNSESAGVGDARRGPESDLAREGIRPSVSDPMPGVRPMVRPFGSLR
jgi:hypothetical protein